MRLPPRSTLALLGLACAAASAPRLAAAQTASQTVTFEVQPINQISVSGNPEPLLINTTLAGTAPSQVSSATTNWSITTNEAGKKVTAALNSAMPAGVALRVSLAAPGGASSTGPVQLGTTAVDVVTGISTLNAAGLTITYTLSAAPTAGIVAQSNRTVTFTLVTAS